MRAMGRTTTRHHATHPASVLLLTVMTMAILTTTTLGAIALRFQQLTSTDQVTNGEVAKLAAQSGLVKLKDKLATGSSFNPTTLDLSSNTPTEKTVTSTDAYKPNARHVATSYEKVSTTLPRCLAVAVLSPWIQDGSKYLYQTTSSSNPAMIFQFANIINETALGTIRGNGGLSLDQKKLTVSDLTNMGKFYNPFAAANTTPDKADYWTVKVGGPQDQFLTKKGASPTLEVYQGNSFYKGVDFIYVPYLPRFIDSVLPSSAGSIIRIPGQSAVAATDTLRKRFEDTITSNNFKVWLDASVDETQLSQSGFGDLFTDARYKVSWLQPSLWNDLPETSLAGMSKSADISASTVSWASTGLPTYSAAADSPGWNVSILRGSITESFISFNSAVPSFTNGTPVSGKLFGSLEGLRLKEKLSLQLLDSSYVSQGSVNATLTSLGPISGSGTAEQVPITITPTGISGSGTITPPKSIAAASISVTAGAFPSVNERNSLSNVTVKVPTAGNVTINGFDATQATCNTLAAVPMICPTVGDIVGLSKSGSTPLWGQVKRLVMASGGQSLSSVSFDSLYAAPKPVRSLASTTFVRGGRTLIAYYGGEVVANDVDPGLNAQSSELWIYDPEANTWQFLPYTSGDPTPGKREGASIIYDQARDRLLLYGGYYREYSNSVAADPDSFNSTADTCLKNLINTGNCFSQNDVTSRYARYFPQSLYAFNFGGATPNKWQDVTATMQAPARKLENTDYILRTVSTIGDRSGDEGQTWNIRQTGAPSATVALNPSGNTSWTFSPFKTTAGLAKGDDVEVNATLAGYDTNCWPAAASSVVTNGRVTSVNFVANTVTVQVAGLFPTCATNATTSNIRLKVNYRVPMASTCQGNVAGLYCETTDTAGYSVGDQVVLEHYNFTSGHSLSYTLTGYISYIDSSVSPNRIYFVPDERSSDRSLTLTNNFTDHSATYFSTKVTGAQPLGLPVAGFGGQALLDPGTPTTVAWLYQGGAKVNDPNFYASSVWKLDLASLSAQAQTLHVNTGLTGLQGVSQSGVRMQILSSTFTDSVFTDNSAQQINRGGASWSSATLYTLNLNSAGAEYFANSKAVPGAKITIQKVVNGTTVTFHGVIDSSTMSQPGKLIITHDGGFSSDPDFGTASNVRVQISSQYLSNILEDRLSTSSSTVETLSGNTPTNTTTVTISNQQPNDIPPSGSTILLWYKTNGSQGYGFIGTVKDRSYVGPNTYRITYQGGAPINSPLPKAYQSNFIAYDSLNALGTTVYSQNEITIKSDDNTRGPAEFYSLPQTSPFDWRTYTSRVNAAGTNQTERPNPHLGYATASIQTAASQVGGAQNSRFYELGGSFGRFANVWQKTYTAQTIVVTDPPIALNKTVGNTPWVLPKAPTSQSADLTNLSGATLSVYQVGGAGPVKAVVFGGKFKGDLNTNDYGRKIGPYMVGSADSDSWHNSTVFPVTDSEFSITNASPVGSDAKQFVNIVDNSFPFASDPALSQLRYSMQLDATPVDTYTSTNARCGYFASQSCGGNQEKQFLGNLGTLGRIDGNDASSLNHNTFLGQSAQKSPVLLNPGTRFLYAGASTDPAAILTNPAFSGLSTNNNWKVSGYTPYGCGISTEPGCGAGQPFYGNMSTKYGTDKTMLFAGYAPLEPGGAILVTTTGVGTALAAGRGSDSRGYTYCAKDNINDPINFTDFACKSGQDMSTALRNGSWWLPDPEDISFLFNASVALGVTDTYKVVGYYGGIKRGYLVITRKGVNPTVEEIVP